jgi:hypothetical protein
MNGLKPFTSEIMMKKCLATTAIVLSVSTALAAEPAPMRDILGIHPGMSYTQAMGVAADLCKGAGEMSSPEIPSLGFSSIYVKCPAGMRQEFFAAKPNLKQDREEALLLVFAADLPEQPLSSVVYSFVSKASDQDLIQEIAGQFGLPSVCDKTENNTLCFRDGLQSMIVTHLVPQGWTLSFTRQSSMPDTLNLFDQQIVEAENAAGMERAKTNKLAPTLGAKR